MIKATIANGTKTLIQSGLPFVVPSSGSVAVTTGVITLTTPLDIIYPQCYMYFPINTFTGSVAGFYYVTMSSTTAGVMTSTRYVSGLPVVPAAPVTVITGAGAYIQDTGVVTGQTISIDPGALGTDSKIDIEIAGRCLNSATGKSFSVIFGGNNLGATSSTTTNAVIQQCIIASRNNVALQSYTNRNFITGGANIGDTTVNTAVTVTLSAAYQIVAATDYLVSRWFWVGVYR